jgi:hypothetical protein
VQAQHGTQKAQARRYVFLTHLVDL